MSQETIRLILIAYFQRLVYEEFGYICKNDLLIGLKYGILSLSRKDAQKLKSGGMVHATFDDYSFACPVTKPKKRDRLREKK